MKYEITKNYIPGLPTRPYRYGYGAMEGVVGHSTAVYEDTDTGERTYECTHWHDAFVTAFCDYDSITEVSNPEYKAGGAGPSANLRYAHVELCQTRDPIKFKESYARWTWYIAHLLFSKRLGVTDEGTLWSHFKISQKYPKETDHTDPIAYLAEHGKSWADVVADVSKEYEELEDEDMKVCKTYDDVPDWGKPTIRKLLDDGSIKGDDVNDPDDVGLSEESIKVLTILDRRGLL